MPSFTTKKLLQLSQLLYNYRWVTEAQSEEAQPLAAILSAYVQQVGLPGTSRLWPFPNKSQFPFFPFAWTSTGFLAVSTKKMTAEVMLHDFKTRSQKGYPSTWPFLPLRILALESSHHAVMRLKLAHIERPSGEDLRPQQQPALTLRTVSGWALSGLKLPIFEPPQLTTVEPKWALLRAA